MMVGPVSFTASDARSLWLGLSRNQRISLAGLAALAVVLLAVFVNIARVPDYGVAFSNLKDDEAAAIVAKLKEAKIPYELADKGIIKVQNGQVQEARLLAAAAGLTTKGSNVGMEMFGQPHFGLTEFAEKVNYQRALEGELARTINRLDAVEMARVHVVVPEPSLFTSDKKEPTAAAVLQLKPGRKLDGSQVQGISQLIMGSVEGLKSQNISVMDTAGNVLTDRAGDSDPARQTNSRAEVRRTLEARIAEDVRTMLVPVVGQDRSVVRVSAELDWDQYESNSETFSPQQKAPQVRSKREIAETASTTNSAAGGVPGTERNVPGYSATQNQNGQNQSERKDTTTNYELSKTMEKTTRAPGGIKRLNVAVALDSEVIADPVQADAISKLVATTAGLDTNRGDLVTLSSLPFSPAEKKVGDIVEAARQREMTFNMIRLAAMIVGPLLVIGLVWLILSRGRPRSVQPVITVSGPRNEIGALTDAGSIDGQRGLMPAREEDPEQIRLTNELTSMAKTEPAMVAQLIQSWLQEDRRAL